jgi:rubredoxin
MATYGRELLVHFHCASCAGWWSIGDPQARLAGTTQDLLNKTWYCPWCGLAQTVTGPTERGPQQDLPAHPAHTTVLTEPGGTGPAE